MSTAGTIVALINTGLTDSSAIARKIWGPLGKDELKVKSAYVRAVKQRTGKNAKAKRRKETAYATRWIRNKLRTNPKAREKQRAYQRQWKSSRYDADPVFRARTRWNASRWYYRKVHGIDIGEWRP